MLTTKYNKNITFTNEISIDGQLAYTQNATINIDRNEFSINDWIANIDLYSAHRLEIRKAKNEFEDKVFSEKESIDKEFTEMNKEEETPSDKTNAGADAKAETATDTTATDADVKPTDAK